MRLVIIESTLHGHVEPHIKAIVAEATRRGCQITLYNTREWLEDPAFVRVKQAGNGCLGAAMVSPWTHLLATSWLSRLRNQYRCWRSFAATYREMDVGNRPDFIYVVNLDALDKAAAILGSPFGDTPFGGMMVLPRFHHRAAGLVSAGSRCDRLYGHLFASLLRTKSLRLVTTIDPLLAPWCRDLGLRESHKVAFVPDIGDLSPDEFSRSGARSMLGLNQDAFVLLVYGLINPSKGVRELLQAIDGDHWPVGLQLLVVGRPDEAMGALIADQKFSMMQREGRVIARIGYAGADLTSAAFRSASAVWLGYKGHDNMSGVLCQATEAGVPVVACRNGLVGLYTKAHGIGEVVNVDNPCEIVGAIRRLMSSSGPLAAYASNAARLRNTHTPTVFGRTICDAIMSQL